MLTTSRGIFQTLEKAVKLAPLRGVQIILHTSPSEKICKKLAKIFQRCAVQQISAHSKPKMLSHVQSNRKGNLFVRCAESTNSAHLHARFLQVRNSCQIIANRTRFCAIYHPLL
jgi:hypothetical protein